MSMVCDCAMHTHTHTHTRARFYIIYVHIAVLEYELLQDEFAQQQASLTALSSSLDNLSDDKSEEATALEKQLGVTEERESQMIASMEAQVGELTATVRRKEEELEAKDVEITDFYSQLEVCADNVEQLAELNSSIADAVGASAEIASGVDKHVELFCKIGCR